MSLPVIELSGTPYEQGLQHGRALRAGIVNNLAVYFDRFEREAGLGRDELLDRSRRYLTALRRQSEEYIQGMRGIADATGIPFDEIAVLNLRYELLYFQISQKAMKTAAGEDAAGENAAAGNPAAEGAAGEGGEEACSGGAHVDGCTAFALLPEATREGHLLMGQNWDWIPGVAGALLSSEEPDGLRILAFTEAGILGAKVGLNSAGLGLAINGMTTTADDWTRLARPFHLRCYEILRARDFNAALDLIVGEERSCTTNYLIAQTPGKVADLEAAPTKVNRLACEEGCLVHANHFRDPEKLGVVEPPNPMRPWSRHREARLRDLLASGGPFGVEDVMARLRDHDGRPNSVCRHMDPGQPEEERIETLSSVVMDLNAGRLWASDGPPCGSDYQELTLEPKVQ